MDGHLHFIVVDDDPLNNKLCDKIIKHAVAGADVRTFTLPEQGFHFLTSDLLKMQNGTPWFLFLDLNMPDLDGWQFLERFDHVDNQIKQQLKIYILTSSINETDKERAAKNKYVIEFISKPLSIQKVISLSAPWLS